MVLREPFARAACSSGGECGVSIVRADYAPVQGATSGKIETEFYITCVVANPLKKSIKYIFGIAVNRYGQVVVILKPGCRRDRLVDVLICEADLADTIYGQVSSHRRIGRLKGYRIAAGGSGRAAQKTY